MTLVLHDSALDDRCYRVRLMAALIGVPLVTVAVDTFPGRAHLGEACLALNPFGGVPILTDGDIVLAGAEAILVHLAEAHDPQRRFMPQAPAERARTMHWLFLAAREFDVATQARAAAVMEAPGNPARLRAAARDALRLLDDHLTLQAIDAVGFVAGPQPSVADVALFPAFALSRDFGVDHDAFPALRAWSRRVRALAGFVTMPGIPDYH